MRKLIAIVFALVLFIFGTGSLFAADNDYKNNLLKMDIKKLDDNNYNIGVYTQKVYNEPIKVIKKSDTVYYFLLPETSNAITSVPALGSITNILVKTYPYAGQDLRNGYTKVAIITDRPINISTTLKTLDPSISPRLDPLRLAKLDEVFDRYSRRLAENNIPTPLSEFRKSHLAQADTKAVQKTAQVPVKTEKVAQAQPKKPQEQVKKQATQKIASAQPQTKKVPAGVDLTNTRTFEEYQNRVLASQPANKAAVTQKKATVPVQKQQAPAASKQTPVAKKPVSLPKTASNVQKQAQPQKVASKPVVQQKQPVPQQQKVASKPATATKPAPAKQAAPADKPKQIAVAPVSKTITPVKQNIPVTVKPQSQPAKPAPAQPKASSQPAKPAKPTAIASKPAIPSRTTEPVKSAETKIAVNTPSKEVTPSSKPQPEKSAPSKQAVEMQKQLVNTKPIEVEFTNNPAAVPAPAQKEIVPEIKDIPPIVPEQVAPKQPEQIASKPQPVKPANAPANNNSNLIPLGVLFMILGVSYTFVKLKSRAAAKRMEISNNSDIAKEGVKDLFKNKKVRTTQTNAPHVASAVDDDILPVSPEIEEPVAQPEVHEPSPVFTAAEMAMASSVEPSEYSEAIAAAEQARMEEAKRYENIKAFNESMNSVSEEPVQQMASVPYSQSIIQQTEDDAVIQELYTPIEPTPSFAEAFDMYNTEDEEPVSYTPSYEPSFAPVTSPVAGAENFVSNVDDKDTAQIVSSSKLTETRGLYLAKFEGTTSLVGYIQDDIYVLYNFGELEVKETDIESRLAHENDTDSLYIVKTGGKKLMVKSSPFDMSLEMVM